MTLCNRAQHHLGFRLDRPVLKSAGRHHSFGRGLQSRARSGVISAPQSPNSYFDNNHASSDEFNHQFYSWSGLSQIHIDQSQYCKFAAISGVRQPLFISVNQIWELHVRVGMIRTCSLP